MAMIKSKHFVIADTHFEDTNIIKYEHRPFSSVYEMKDVLIANWNAVVNKDDTVYILGDFVDKGSEYVGLKAIVSKLNGHKVLIMGNHDNFTKEQYKDAGIEDVIEYPILYNNWFILSHEPLYMSECSPYANIFGHVHGNPLYKTVSSRGACVSVERIGFTPVLLDDIIEKIKTQL